MWHCILCVGGFVKGMEQMRKITCALVPGLEEGIMLIIQEKGSERRWFPQINKRLMMNELNCLIGPNKADSIFMFLTIFLSV